MNALVTFIAMPLLLASDHPVVQRVQETTCVPIGTNRPHDRYSVTAAQVDLESSYPFAFKDH